MMARRSLLDHVPILPAQIRPIRCSGSPREGAERYEDTLRAFFEGNIPCFDIVFLGLGENGHTASLFPGSAVVEERERWVAEVYPPGGELSRVTVTAPVINQAALIAFLVAGERKSAVLREVVEGSADPRVLPARLIRPVNGELFWLVDRSAARLLRKAARAQNR